MSEQSTSNPLLNRMWLAYSDAGMTMEAFKRIVGDEIESLRMTERLNVETVAALQRERDEAVALLRRFLDCKLTSGWRISAGPDVECESINSVLPDVLAFLAAEKDAVEVLRGALEGDAESPEAGRLVGIGIATWAQALDIIGQCAEIDAMDDHAESWIREADKFFDEHSSSLTKVPSVCEGRGACVPGGEESTDQCFSAGCKKPAVSGSVLCQEHYDALPGPMRGDENAASQHDVQWADDKPLVPPGHFWRGEINRFYCKNCGGHWDAHLHTDLASTCPEDGKRDDVQPPTHVYRFARYRRGQLMASGAVIEKCANQEDALRVARRVFEHHPDDSFVLAEVDGVAVGEEGSQS